MSELRSPSSQVLLRMITLSTLMPADSAVCIGYLESILEGNDLLVKADLTVLARNGSFFVSAPPGTELEDSRALFYGLEARGYSLREVSTALIGELVDAHLTRCAVLDPFFTAAENRRRCPSAEYVDTRAGLWQVGYTIDLMCYIRSAHYFFPLVFFTANDLKYSDNVCADALNTAAYLLVEAFDNDGFILWARTAT
jgi:hypothetical protein